MVYFYKWRNGGVLIVGRRKNIYDSCRRDEY